MSDLDEARKIWDEAASTFDNEADHGLRDASVRAAWADLLNKFLPEDPVKILDAGCGTASLSLLCAEMGHAVNGIDFSPAMIAQAESKAEIARQSITFQVMDAAHPMFEPSTFDIVICRHLLWTLREPAEVLQRWITLLKLEGRLILIEGFWETGAGLKAQTILAMLPAKLTDVSMQNLSNQPNLWGKTVSDERYIISAKLAK